MKSNSNKEVVFIETECGSWFWYYKEDVSPEEHKDDFVPDQAIGPFSSKELVLANYKQKINAS